MHYASIDNQSIVTEATSRVKSEKVTVHSSGVHDATNADERLLCPRPSSGMISSHYTKTTQVAHPTWFLLQETIMLAFLLAAFRF